MENKRWKNYRDRGLFLQNEVNIDLEFLYLEKSYFNNNGRDLTEYVDKDPVMQLIEDDIQTMLLNTSNKIGFTSAELLDLTLELRRMKLCLQEIPKEKVINDNFQKGTWRIHENVNTENIRDLFYDPYYGIIKNIYKDLNSFKTAVVGAEFRVGNNIIFAYGRDDSFNKAESAALLELVERDAMYNVELESVEIDYNSADKNLFVNPERFMHYVQEDGHDKRKAFDPKKKIKWVPMENYFTKKKSYIPRQFVDLSLEDEDLFILSNSSGVALGSSRDEARLYAIFELIERDAFLTFWHKRPQLKELDPMELNENIISQIRGFETDNKKVHIFDMTFDISIPTILALVISNTSQIHTYMSTATHPDYEKAIEGALNECLVGHRIYETNEEVKKRKYPSENEVDELFDHVCYSSRMEFIKEYEYLLNKQLFKPQDIYVKEKFAYLKKARSAGELLEEIIENQINNKEIYFVDLTTKMSSMLGLCVEKVMSPDFSQMSFGYRHRQINLKRLDESIENSPYMYNPKWDKGDYYDRVHPYA